VSTVRDLSAQTCGLLQPRVRIAISFRHREGRTVLTLGGILSAPHMECRRAAAAAMPAQGISCPASHRRVSCNRSRHLWWTTPPAGTSAQHAGRCHADEAMVRHVRPGSLHHPGRARAFRRAHGQHAIARSPRDHDRNNRNPREHLTSTLPRCEVERPMEGAPARQRPTAHSG
jgi:hypothetical protein